LISFVTEIGGVCYSKVSLFFNEFTDAQNLLKVIFTKGNIGSYFLNTTRVLW